MVEIHLEELGQHSWVKGVLNTVMGSAGSAQFRFVARPPGDDRGDNEIAGDTFPVMRFQELDNPREPNAWLEASRECLVELDQRLVETGWHRRPGAGPHWWSRTYTREGRAPTREALDAESAAANAANQADPEPWVRRHSFVAFVGLAYAISWTLWLISAAGGGIVPFLLGALGPMAAAAIVTHLRGDSLATWIRPVWRWRVAPRWWCYALGLPAALYGVVSIVLQLLGEPIDWGLAVDRLPGYATTFAFVLFLGGGMEEPGWRGFGLPLLQERSGPLRATLFVGLAWGFWHVPVYGPAGFVVPAVLAFFYTVLWNRTHSVGLCILLHASFTPAQDQLILMSRDRAYSSALDMPDWVILATYVAAALVLAAITRGRLGLPASAPPVRGANPRPGD